MAANKPIQYPFVPKSTTYLREGQFWAIPISGGRFGCGYVVAVDRTQRRMFVAGVTDWHGDRPPTASDLIGHRVVEHAQAHLKSSTETGGEILGCCDTPLDVVPDEREHTWGYNVVRILAEKYARSAR